MVRSPLYRSKAVVDAFEAIKNGSTRHELSICEYLLVIPFGKATRDKVFTSGRRIGTTYSGDWFLGSRPNTNIYMNIRKQDDTTRASCRRNRCKLNERSESGLMTVRPKDSWAAQSKNSNLDSARHLHRGVARAVPVWLFRHLWTSGEMVVSQTEALKHTLSE